MIKPSFHYRCLTASLGAALFAVAPLVHGEVITLQPVADTSLHEIFPKNNFGAFTFFHGAVTGKDTRTRGLVRFDVSQVPEGAQVTAVMLEVTVVFIAPALEAAEVEFGLHRMLTPWGEGNKNAGAGMGGRPATDGEASWEFSSSPTEWQEGGGAPGADFAATPASMVVMGDVGQYTFPSTPELISDVQSWVDSPNENFGWMLKSVGEDVLQSAKRLGSRESSSAAALTIEYSVGVSELVITSVELRDGQLFLQWNGGVPPYQLQARGPIGETAWENVGEPVTGTEAQTPADGEFGFIRVLSGE